MTAWTEQVNAEGEVNSHYIRVVTKPCNMKLVIGITLISVNQNSSWNNFDKCEPEQQLE